ncbi:adenosine deaminase [Actinopolymorpha cephalotaxi]|uniref:adenosine deaminase n=1 Tax=Actinopolymorpha cephalotaxi TaxID=504797 RepID=A0A1I2ZK98_9ACTN|nr:adenosine deaminase [Actinopolymorpha cephalotaxi]NYH82037.1 adenosine deaminase [Actinopolymorpha cephalotaxi]SFH38075.1 adenosine deaminase [Actinopolymorpha cephalotaxi]
MTELDDLGELRALPKIELHSHLDCGLSYDAVRRIDPRISREHYDRQFVAPSVCDSLGDYLTHTFNYRAVLQSERALRIAVEDAFAQLAADGAAYAELRFAPMIHVEDGLSADEVVEAVGDETVRQIEATGVDAALILCTLRDYDAEQSLRTARLAVRHARIGPVAAFDIAGDEARHPLDTHLPAFGLVADAGLGVTVHAGEGGGPDSVTEALDKTTTRRIGHGVRSVEDADLVARLAAESIHLEVCPSCNVQTAAVASYAAHPVDTLRAAGVPVSVSTDTRAVTDIDLTREYAKLGEAFGWTRADFGEVNRAALAASFADPSVRRRLAGVLDDAYPKVPA